MTEQRKWLTAIYYKKLFPLFVELCLVEELGIFQCVFLLGE